MEQKPLATEQPSELEGIIKRILEIDEQARDVTAKAKEIRVEAEKNIARQKSALKEKYLERARKRIEALTEEERRLADESLEQAKGGQVERIRELNEIFEKNGAAWVEEIYRRTIAD